MGSVSVPVWASRFTLFLLTSLALLLGSAAESPAAYSYAYAKIDYPGASETWATGVNDAGTVVGAYRDAAGVHGFRRDGPLDYTSIDYPGAAGTSFRDINNAGQVVGSYRLAGGTEYSVLYDGSTYTPIRFPDPPHNATYATALNDLGLSSATTTPAPTTSTRKATAYNPRHAVNGPHSAPDRWHGRVRQRGLSPASPT